MYQPEHFREDRPEVIHQLIRSHPLGLLVTCGEDGPDANPVPFELVVDRKRTVLKAHLARANQSWKTIRDHPERRLLAVFQGPQAYVTPSWYPSKQEHGKVVPTWNYAIVQAKGRASIFEEPEALLAHLNALTDHQEEPRSTAWKVGDAPDDFIARQMRGIVGIAIEVETLEGKWKMSQNKSDADRIGVSDGYEADANSDLAALVRGGAG
ncbi:MAG: FMN-binding negative transcriptional regulator [Pseudomonadota bacterium]